MGVVLRGAGEFARVGRQRMIRRGGGRGVMGVGVGVVRSRSSKVAVDRRCSRSPRSG